MLHYAFMTFSTPELALGEVVATAARFGYDAVEPRLDARHAHGIEVAATPAERRAIRDTVARSPVKLACLATSLTYANPATRDERLAETHTRIDLAGDLGVPCLRVFGGQIPAGITRDQAVATLVESLRTVADHAAARGVTLCMETHDDWCDPAHVAQVLCTVNHPAIAANWDIMHPVRTGKASIEQSFAVLRPWIRHLHVHDGVGQDLKLVPIGTGELDHRAALRLLLDAGYTGCVSGEWIGWEPYETHLPRELATLKRYELELR